MRVGEPDYSRDDAQLLDELRQQRLAAGWRQRIGQDCIERHAKQGGGEVEVNWPQVATVAVGRASARSRVASGARHHQRLDRGRPHLHQRPRHGATLATVASFGAGTWLSYSVTSLVTGNGSVAFAYTSASSSPISIASREDAAHAPQLIVTRAAALKPPKGPVSG